MQPDRHQTVAAHFDDVFTLPVGHRIALGRHAFVLRGFALSAVDDLVPALRDIARRAPFRHMVTPGGKPMSVAMTNCGAWGWVSDRRGYRYVQTDPDSGAQWPSMPVCFAELARAAAEAAGFETFSPDACLVNCYRPGTALSLHQDKDESDFDAPIVSVSLGIPAAFLFGGHERGDRPQRIPLTHGDVAVWGREDRLRYHGVARIEETTHPMLGARRINLTFRKAT